jgi:hypothetical protein
MMGNMQPGVSPSSTSRPFKRRSARIQLRIPLAIDVADENVLQAETVTVSKHGAKIRITGFRGKLTAGAKLQVVTRGQQSRTARVVWQDKRADPHYGIELDDPGNFWGVYFPSKNGEEWSFKKKEVHRATVAPTPLAPTPIPSPDVLSEIPETPAATDTASVAALVTGLSAARVPLAEKVDVVFTKPDEACALLQHLVEPGATVRLILPDRIVSGRVAAVGGQRQAGKWRVRIKCEAQSM